MHCYMRKLTTCCDCKMKLIRFCLLFLFAGCATAMYAAEPATSLGKQRIGVYDSRAVAVAFAGSEAHKAWMEPLITEHRKAKAAGDTKRVAELEAEGKARQKRAHTQAFSTAPVDDILEEIKGQLPQIRKNAGASVLISKWDKEQLARYRATEQVDVTMALVDAFKPSEKQRKRAIEIQQRDPIPISQIKD